MADVLVSFVRTTSDKLQSCPKIDGQIVVLTDRPGVFYDALDAEGNLVRNASSEFTYRCTGTNADGSNIEEMISQLKSTGLSSIKLNIVGDFGVDIDKEYQITTSGSGGGILKLDFSNFKVIDVPEYSHKLLKISGGGCTEVTNLCNNHIQFDGCEKVYVHNCEYITLSGRVSTLKLHYCDIYSEAPIQFTSSLTITECDIQSVNLNLTGDPTKVSICNNIVRDTQLRVNGSLLDLTYNNILK